MQSLITIALIACFTLACNCTAPFRGLWFDKHDPAGLPLLYLPYGIWRATSYNKDADFYTFKNIRYGAPPVGPLRWAAPTRPQEDFNTVNDGSYGHTCLQAPVSAPLNLVGKLNESPLGAALDRVIFSVIGGLYSGGNEDCLFLDVTVPGSAVRGESKNLPVIVYIYGGSFVYGNKDTFGPFYQGDAIVKQSKNKVIFVTGNYRVGALGFLAGSSMERDATPNAGLHDVRSMFEWVRENISLVGGDPQSVCAWGLSAGAALLMHLLVANGGTQDPLFRRVVLQSVAHQLLWDRAGLLEGLFNRFASMAGCPHGDVACLRRAPEDVIARANVEFVASLPAGTFWIGPSADGNYIRQLAVLEFMSGYYWKDIDAVIISSTVDEAQVFIDGHITDDNGFNEYISQLFPLKSKRYDIREVIVNQYPPASEDDSPYLSETDRLKDFFRDLVIGTTTRLLSDSYAGKTYNMQYAAGTGWHSTDMFPSFVEKSLDFVVAGVLLNLDLPPSTISFSQVYRSYFTSFAMYGDPNVEIHKQEDMTFSTWPQPDNTRSEFLSPVLRAADHGFSIFLDVSNPRTRSDFWLNVIKELTTLGGYPSLGSSLPADNSIANMESKVIPNKKGNNSHSRF